MFSPTTEREQRLDELIAQFFARLEAGDAVSPDAWAEQYPEYREELCDFFLEEQQLERFTGPLRRLLKPFGLPDGTRALGDYRLVRELGRGGMGVVYEAEQLSLSRRVALKVLPFAAMLDERQLRRFKNEAHAAAVLKHPHIVSVFAIGCERGTHFYVMELVEGHSLAEVIAELRTAKDDLQPDEVGAWLTHAAPASIGGSPDNRHSASTLATAALPTELSQANPRRFRAAAELAIQAAEALAYAHREGVIHRDIKPSNLLLDGEGKLWITDFGLARLPSGGDLTLTGDVLGTLRYMSPEQLAGQDVVDQRTDVYSLGLTLYELLAGRAAFTDDHREQLVRRIMEDDPTPLRMRDPRIPRDLETIVLRATAKDREARYQNAQELADDLRRFLDAKPIRARRTARLQRVRYWARRNPGVAVLTTVVFVLLTVAAVAGSLAALHMARLAKSESDLRADTFLRLYAADMNRTKEALDRGDLTTALLLLERYRNPIDGVDPRGFEWYFLWQQCEPLLTAKALPHEMNVFGVAFSPTSPSGDLLATSQWMPQVNLWDSHTGKRTRAIYGHTELILDVNFTPDGTRVLSASADATARVWNVLSGKEVMRLTLEQCEVRALALAPHAPFAALGVNGQFAGYPSRAPARIIIWNYETNEIMKELDGLVGRVEEVAFSPDGKLLVAGCHDDKLWRFDTSTWEELPPISAHGNGVLALAFSADGAILATSSGLRTDRFVGGEIKLWSPGDGQLLATIGSHRDAVWAVAFAKLSPMLITAAHDGEIAIWDIADPTQPRVLKRFLAHSLGISDLAVSPNDELLASSGNDNIARLWNIKAILAEADPVVRLGPHVREVIDCAFDRGGSAVWACAIDDGATLRDVASGGVRDKISGKLTGRIYMAACDEDRLLMLIGSDAGSSPPVQRAVCYDTRTRDALWSIDALGHVFAHVEIAPVRRADDVRLAAIPTPTDLRIVNALNGSEIKRLPLGVCNRFSRDGRLLAVVVLNGGVEVFDTTTWTLKRDLKDAVQIGALDISPDDRHLATGASDNVVKIWDMATGEPVVTCTGHDDDIWSLEYSPDGKRIVSAGKDGSVRLWDTATGECVLRLSEPQGWVVRVCFSADGRQIAAASIDRHVHAWRIVSSPEILNQSPTLDRTLIAPPSPEEASKTWLPISVTEADWHVAYYRWKPSSASGWQSPQSWEDVFGSPPIREQRTRLLNFDWGSGAPASDVPPNYFALVATASIELAEGKYTLTTQSDDGVRVYFDGERVIDDWAAGPPKRNDAQLEVKAGKHEIRLEYFEGGGGAMLQLGIIPTKP
jgi:WD40 repeat protein/serine/threonine protein kinase